MSLTKIGLTSSPDIQAIKKNINHDALYHNIRQQQTKMLRKQLQRQKQLQQFQFINRRVSTQLNQQINQKKQKKSYIQHQLAHFYDQQIEQKKLVHDQEIKKNRSYAQAAQQNQKQYHQKRSRQLARIYRAQKTFQSINPQSQSILANKKKTLLSQNFKAYQAPQKIPQKEITYNRTRFQIQIPHQSYQVSPVDSRIVQPYKDYLKQQIQKKRLKKQEQFRNRLEIQKQLIRTNQQALLKQRQQLKQIQRKQKQAFRKGLQEQIAEKKHFKSFL